MNQGVLREVEAVGGRVWVEGERLRYRLPADRCDLIEMLRERKAEIVAALAPPPSPPSPDGRTLIQTDGTVATAAAAFHGHLFGPGRSTGCCAARHGRYCAEGARLREAYHCAHRIAEGRE